ncbi:threonine synthase [Fictibacillus nanhaiensis]|uniref:threonine synthase n=1 Tax=Fictibacillus nanhaiensis TaxID=742169 RepID=UPI001C97BF65|nr:threonine synthase [Fictibacillus nanhaiensis]MBY6036801.1 threonine synthase [Fictibacillus nanhaiensis]
MHWKGLLTRYNEYLPVNENTPSLSLNEGNTPLIPLHHLSKEWGISLYAKYEGANPTGSFKDRGMVLAVAKAKEAGSKVIICASTGNTSAAAAAYGARAGLRCIVVIPDGKIAQGKLAQAKMYGAEIFAIQGNFDEALEMVKQMSEEEGYTLVNSVNPFRLEGQKTAAFELVDALEQAPDILAIPVGNAGNISAYWKGFKEYHSLKSTGLPRIHGFQAAGAAPIVNGSVIENPETIATAIRIGNPASWQLATEALEESGGCIDSVTDEEILEAYQLLACKEGVFAEPASCSTIAGLYKQMKQGLLPKGVKVVAVLTGNGLKDPDIALKTVAKEPAIIPNDLEQLRQQLKGCVV